MSQSSEAVAPPAQFRRGVRLGVDWGYARVGMAACDPDGVLSYPLETIPAKDQLAALARVIALVSEHQPIEVVMGLPIALNGQEALAAGAVADVADRLASQIPVPLRLLDERLTTAAATRQLSNIDTRKRRRIVDQAAATGILEDALRFERHTGTAPGRLVESSSTKGKA